MEFRIDIFNRKNPKSRGDEEIYSNRKEARKDAAKTKKEILAAEKKTRGTRGKDLDVTVRPVRNDKVQSPSTSNQKTNKR